MRCDKINFRQAYKTESIDNAVFGIPETTEKLGFYKLQLCENFISPGVLRGTKIAQSFGIPETTEKLGFYKLQLCENLFLRVFYGE